MRRRSVARRHRVVAAPRGVWRHLAPAFPAVALELVMPGALAGGEVQGFGMLGIDGGVVAFQLVSGGLRSESATLEIEVDGLRLGPWRWQRTPGVARARVSSPRGTIEAEAAAVSFSRLELEGFCGPASADSIPARVPVALIGLDFHPAAAAVDTLGGAEISLRLRADSGRAQAVRLRGGAVTHRSAPARAVSVDSTASLIKVAVEDSLLLALDSSSTATAWSTSTADTFELAVAGREAWTLELLMPAVPIPLEMAPSLTDNQGRRRAVSRAWATRLEPAGIDIPEGAFDLAVDASLYHILAGSLVACGERVAVLGGPFYYREFYMRDASFVVTALDRMGFHRDARAALLAMLELQGADGELVSQSGQYDGTGQALWALGDHLALTRDPAFASAVLPAVGRAVDWYRGALARSPELDHGRFAADHAFPGLLPKTTINDNEQITAGHIVGHNLWAFAGLQGAVDVARVAQHADSLAAWRSLLADFSADLDRHLEALLDLTGGRLTPAFEGLTAPAAFPGPYGRQGGLDWGNLGIAFPSGHWRGDDPRVRPNLERWSASLREGLLPYPIARNPHLVHHYLVTSLAHGLLASGRSVDREHLFEIIYDGLLGHTTWTMGGAELWNLSTRDVWTYDNIPPHNTFSARFLLLVRDLFVHGRGDTLVVGAGVSPAWIHPGARFGISGAATRFGPVSVGFEVRGHAPGPLDVDVHVETEAEAEKGIAPPAPLAAIELRAPLGWRIRGVSDAAGGSPGTLAPDGGAVILAPASASCRLELTGSSDPRRSWRAARQRLGR